jgi:hypothetical protein
MIDEWTDRLYPRGRSVSRTPIVREASTLVVPVRGGHRQDAVEVSGVDGRRILALIAVSGH